jgi:hypothetical protein
MKKHSTSLTTKEMQIKIMVRVHLTLVRIVIKKTLNAGKDAMKGTGKGALYTIAGNVN